MGNTDITQNTIAELKKEVKNLESISIVAMENFESELSQYSNEFSGESPVEILSLHPDRPLACDIKQII